MNDSPDKPAGTWEQYLTDQERADIIAIEYERDQLTARRARIYERARKRARRAA